MWHLKGCPVKKQNNVNITKLEYMRKRHYGTIDVVDSSKIIKHELLSTLKLYIS